MIEVESKLWGLQKVLRTGLTAEAWCEGTLGVVLELAGIDDEGKTFRVKLGKDQDGMLDMVLELVSSVQAPLDALRA